MTAQDRRNAKRWRVEHRKDKGVNTQAKIDAANARVRANRDAVPAALHKLYEELFLRGGQKR